MVTPHEITKQVNIILNKDSWVEMRIIDVLTYMSLNKSNYALIKNDKDEIAMITVHETSLQPVFMESCASLYILNHLNPEIKTGVCGMINNEHSYIVTIKKRDKLLRFPKDSWSFNKCH